MELLVALSDLTILVDPELGVLDLLGVGVVARLVDTNRDRERVLLGRFLKTKNEDRLVCSCAEFKRLLGAMAKVVSGLREEDSLESM